MSTVYITRKMPGMGVEMLRGAGHQVDVSAKDGVLTKEEIVAALRAKEYGAVLCHLTDTIDKDVLGAAPKAKIFANYAVGYNNIDLAAARERNIVITNTPDVLTDTVAEFTFTLLLAISKRIVEADGFMRAGKYTGWAPELLLGVDLKRKTLGLLGAGRIGSRVAYMASRALLMKVIYYDVKQNEHIEKETGATFRASVEEVLREADVVTIHVPLLDSTKHLINKERLAMMKPSAYLINTSRGPVVDEAALVDALKNGVIRGAAIDVFENEPKMAEGLAALPNVIITPHIAPATVGTRGAMGELAAQNIIAILSGKPPVTEVKG